MMQNLITGLSLRMRFNCLGNLVESYPNFIPIFLNFYRSGTDQRLVLLYNLFNASLLPNLVSFFCTRDFPNL